MKRKTFIKCALFLPQSSNQIKEEYKLWGVELTSEDSLHTVTAEIGFACLIKLQFTLLKAAKRIKKVDVIAMEFVYPISVLKWITNLHGVYLKSVGRLCCSKSKRRHALKSISLSLEIQMQNNIHRENTPQSAGSAKQYLLRQTLNFYHHLEIRGKQFNGLVSVSPCFGLGLDLVSAP